MSHELALALLTTSASLGLAAAVPAATAASLGLVDADATPLPLARNLSSAGGGGGARPWGPPDLEQVCVDGICHRFGRLRAPLDHDDPAQGDWDLTYFVNSNFWDPIAHPHAPIFINMGYGSTDVPGYTASALRQVDDATFFRGFVGTSAEFARELGALIINVPNRYYGCETARAGNPEGSCPASLEAIPAGEAGVIEAHARLRFLSLKAVVDDLALVAKATITAFAPDWGMTLAGPPGAQRAPNQPIVFGCSWPGAAAVYARMLHPSIFPAAVATSHPLVSSPDGNNHYRSFIGHAYELYAAGGSLECKNVLQVGHEEIRRRIETDGVVIDPVGSCVPSGSGSCCTRNCAISQALNSDFGLGPDEWHAFGIGVPGLPRVQTIDRDCAGLGCDIASTCGYLLQCFDGATAPLGLTFPVSSQDPLAAGAAYQCLRQFSAAVRSPPDTKNYTATATAAPAAREEQEAAKEREREREHVDPMVFDHRGFVPANDLGPRVYESSTLTYTMFGFKGPLWMTQTCNDGSECPFVQGNAGGGSYEQINAILWASYGTPGTSLTAFTESMRAGARVWHEAMGGQRPWSVSWTELTNVYMVYNDADPWTAPGAVGVAMPPGRNITYDLGGGGVSHCIYRAEGAQDSIREWARVELESKAATFKTDDIKTPSPFPPSPLIH